MFILIFRSLICLILLFAWIDPPSLLLAAEPDLPLEKPPLVLGLGEQRYLRIRGLSRYSLGSPVVRVLPLNKTFRSSSQSAIASREALLLKGVQTGVGDLWIWKEDGSSEFRTIRVEKRVFNEKSLPLERALGNLSEVEIVYSGLGSSQGPNPGPEHGTDHRIDHGPEQGVVLRGEVQSFSESAKISALLQSFPKEVHDETQLSEELLLQAQEKLSHWLKTSHFAEKLRLERIEKSLWLRGAVERPSERSIVERQARAQFPLIQLELESLPDSSPTVHFRVFLLELRKTHFSSLGLSWPGSVGNAFQITSGSVQNFLNIDLAIQQLEGSGNAKILSNPELVVRAPGEAELFAGGELPIQAQSRFYSNISWKNFGLTLRLKVAQSAGDRVRLEVFTEVSHLDPTIATDRIPGIQANRMKTQVDARYETPLFLSGLLQQGIREEARGLPFLKNIPVLGLLFGSQDYLNERSELVAILYPHATPPHTPEEKSTHWIPRGPLPLPRNWISPQEENALRRSEDYPWNVLD